ncbi:MAG: hypothetical protein Q9172_002924 [Xanthocarpia lactea]
MAYLKGMKPQSEYMTLEVAKRSIPTSNIQFLPAATLGLRINPEAFPHNKITMPCGLSFRRRPKPEEEEEDSIRIILRALTERTQANTAEQTAKYERRKKRYEQEDLEEARGERRREERRNREVSRGAAERRRTRVGNVGGEEAERRREASGRQERPQAVGGATDDMGGRRRGGRRRRSKTERAWRRDMNA